MSPNKQYQSSKENEIHYISSYAANKQITTLTIVKKVKLAHTRLPSEGFRNWSWYLAVSLQVTES